MKKINIIALLSLMALTGCIKEDDSFNNDRDRAYDVPAEISLTDAQKEIADEMTTANVNLNIWRYMTQYWAATQYTTESRYRITTRTIPDNIWEELFRDGLGNLETAKKSVAKEVIPPGITQEDWNIQQANKMAILDIQEVYTWQILVDTFGDIPYSQALNPANPLPAYDDDAAIYPQLIERLDADLAAMNDSGTSFATGDYIYNGDVASWIRFANSLKVKIGINLSDVNSALAQSTIESAVAGGVITQNDQNALFRYQTGAPNYNPIYANLVANGRNDYVPASPIVDAMNALNDPRRSAYFTQKDGAYVGGHYGFTNAYANFSHVSDMIKAPDFPGVLMEATEIDFYLAEAAARGYNVGGTAESYYNDAITRSFEFWGVGDASTYLADPNVAWATAPGDYKQKIGTQAWIAFYNRGFESWNEWRRLDYPQLTVPTSAYPEAEGEIPKRFTYPVIEQTVNGTNYNNASTAIGGDALKTHVFWDVN